ncbi:hypothetical protein [Kingella oralis]|uniref:hypothetical protein n=1 Tax=Kingella oralis TaxID=505 RepID=UPI0028F14C0E|nr:hypothetical protein [Kingella oralis]
MLNRLFFRLPNRANKGSLKFKMERRRLADILAIHPTQFNTRLATSHCHAHFQAALIV